MFCDVALLSMLLLRVAYTRSSGVLWLAFRGIGFHF
jgi:hypothetical protein